MVKTQLPSDVLEYFRQQGRRGGAMGGRKAAENMTAAERSERARAGGLKAAANRRAKAKRSAGAKPKRSAD
jgi:hypothetical protein